MSSILEAAHRASIEKERVRAALAGELGPEAQKAEQDRAWCYRASVCLPISLREVERLLRLAGSKKRLLEHFASRGCTLPEEIHAEANQEASTATKAVCIASGKVSPDFARKSTILQLPNGRQFELPIEVREDGIYAHISDEVQAAIDEEVREQNERQFNLVALGYWEWPGDNYSFVMPEKALIQQAPAPLRSHPVLRHSSGKRAQRRQSKPWADRRQIRR